MEGDTWESQENLQNAGDVLREFEEEYSRDNKEVRQQEKAEDSKDYYRGGFPGWLSRCQLRVGIKPLLFISVRQRELVRVLASLVYLLIHNLLGLCT